MSPEIAKFLKTRNEINWRLSELINEREIDPAEVTEFCQLATDYLLSGAISVGLTPNKFAEDFCKKYADGVSNAEAYIQDLSKLTIVLSGRWDLEDECIRKELCI